MATCPPPAKLRTSVFRDRSAGCGARVRNVRGLPGACAFLA